MPSNQQRREAAKRKLQRQLSRREQQRNRRRRNTLIAGTVAVVLVAAGVVWLVTANKANNTAAGATTSGSAGSEAAHTTSAPVTPCTYTANGKAAKKVAPPSNTSPARTGTVDATMSLNGQQVPMTLDRSLAPCSVNSFLSLAKQGFYNDTNCHRLTKSAELNILQCGDPSGKGNGGPGYGYDIKVAPQAKYPVGTLAMANASNTSEGSQFFIVYATTNIPAGYSIIGKVSDSGMKAVQAIADKGVKDNRQSGAPNAAAAIGSITVPEQAVTASTSWPSSPAPGSADPAIPPAGNQPPAQAPATVTK